MPKILMLSDITGLGPGYHVGDEAMAEVAIERLGQLVGKENLILGCASPENVPKTYGIKAFSFYHTPDNVFRSMLWKKPLSYLKSIAINFYQLVQCDKIVVCGGGNMTSVWPGVLESRLRLLKMANFLKKDLYLVSQTMGPYNDSHRENVDKVLKNAKWIGVRDLNFSHTQTSAPAKFALDDACFLESQHNDYTREISQKNKPFACVSMRKFAGMNDKAVLRVATAIERVLSSHKVRTVFIPHHAPGGTEGDIKLAHKIKHVWSHTDFHLVDPIPLASSLKALTVDSEFVVSMRYHQLIFAVSRGIPAVGIYVDEYTEAKLRGSFEALGLKPLVTSIDEIEKNLDSLVQEALDCRELFESAAIGVEGDSRDINEHPYKLIAGVDDNPKTINSLTENVTL